MYSKTLKASLETTYSVEHMLQDLSRYSEELYNVSTTLSVVEEARSLSVESLGHVTEANLISSIYRETLPNDIAVHLSTEGFVESVRSILRKIKEIIGRVLKRIGDFLSYLLSSHAELKLSLTLIENKINAIYGSMYQQPKISLGSLTMAVSSELGVPADYRQYMRGLTELEGQIKLVRDQWVSPAISAVEKFDRIYVRALSNEAGESDLALVNTLTRNAMRPSSVVTGFTRANTLIDNRFTRDHTRVGPPLIGLRSIAVNTPPSTSNGSTVEDARAIQAIRIELVRTSGSSQANNSGEMEVMTPEEMLEVVHICRHLLDLTVDPETRRIRDKINMLNRMVDRPVHDSGESVDSVRLNEYSREILNYFPSYIRWLNQPYISLMGLTDTTVRTSLSLLRLHLASYRQPREENSRD